MATSQDILARLRRYNQTVRSRDPKLAEESMDLGARNETVYTEDLPLQTAEAEIDIESIVMRRERPVLAIKNNAVELRFVNGEDSQIWRDRLTRAAPHLVSAIPAIGRIDLQNGPMEWVGTGWLVAESTIVTNRHVARVFAAQADSDLTFVMGAGQPISADVDFLQEIANPARLVFRLVRPLHIEPEPGPDVAFFQIEMMAGDARLARPIRLAARIAETQNVATIGYPAYDSRIPEPDLMERIYGKVYNKKRLAPGGITRVESTCIWHNCTTLGGNSGSAVIDLDSGEAIGLHYSGSFLVTNYAVRADVVKRLLDGIGSERSAAPKPARPASPPTVPHAPAAVAVAPTRGGGAGRPAQPRGAAAATTITVPLRLNVSVSIDAGTGALVRPVRSLLQRAASSEPEIEDLIEDTEAVPADYADRVGYVPNFLGAEMAVPLPQVTRDADDVLEFQDRGAAESVLRYDHYSVVMSRSRRMCFLSACNIDGKLSKKGPRSAWKWDPRIPRSQQIMKECYGSPPKFSRGHMTRREDPGWGQTAEAAQRGNDDSMHVTNTTPQMQAFNSPIWLALEDYALQHARSDKMRMSVFTGPYFSERDPTMYGVRIPLEFWKVIAFIHDDTGQLCATGYEMNQESTLQPEEEFVFGAFTSPQLGVATQVSIRSIEQKSGIFFGNLAAVDPLSEGNESVGAVVLAPLLALEQIRFLSRDAESRTRKRGL